MSRETSDLEQATRRHYDAYPLEFMTATDQANIARIQPKPFVAFIATRDPALGRIADIGCGPGRATAYLTSKGFDTVGVDLSPASIGMARQRSPQAHFVCASNLALPFANEAFETIVSDGVLHHTPDAHKAFLENVRVLKLDGQMYVGVYNRNRYYFYLYTYIGPVIRWLNAFGLGRLVIKATLIPPYFLVHLIKSGGRRTWKGAENFFYDYFITPQASFHTKEEVLSWGEAAGLELLTYDPTLGNVHVFTFRKTSRSPLSPRPGKIKS